MKKFSKKTVVAVVFTLASSLTACEETLQIKNGKIPSEYTPFVQQFLGEYHGQINLRPTNLVASLEADNRLVLQSQSDLLAPVCRSKIGNLTKIIYKEGKNNSINVTEAFFDFDPNLCGNQIAASKIHFFISKQEPVTLDILLLDHLEWGWRCDGMNSPKPYPPFYNPPYPNQTCWQEQYGVYQQGRFIHD